MNGEQFITAINDADDIYISESMPGISIGSATAPRRKVLRVAVIAACLVLVLGTVAYAAGWFTKPFEVRTEGITIIDKDGNEVAGKAVEVILNAIKPEEVKGCIRDDALRQPEESGGHVMQASDRGDINMVETFSSVKEAIEYFDCDKLEIPYYPCEMSVYVLYSGKQDLSSGSVNIMGSGETDGIRVTFTDMFSIREDGSSGMLGFGLDYVDGSANYIGQPEVSEFDTADGINCKVAEFISDGSYSVQGFLTKNNVVYNISIVCDSSSNKERVVQILHDWAESF